MNPSDHLQKSSYFQVKSLLEGQFEPFFREEILPELKPPVVFISHSFVKGPTLTLEIPRKLITRVFRKVFLGHEENPLPSLDFSMFDSLLEDYEENPLPSLDFSMFDSMIEDYETLERDSSKSYKKGEVKINLSPEYLSVSSGIVERGISFTLRLSIEVTSQYISLYANRSYVDKHISVGWDEKNESFSIEDHTTRGLDLTPRTELAVTMKKLKNKKSEIRQLVHKYSVSTKLDEPNFLKPVIDAVAEFL